MKYLKIRIEVGTANSVFDIYYNSVDSGTRALLYDTGLPAIGLTNEVLEFGEGVIVSVPDNATSIILSSDPAAFCTEIPNVNDVLYTIPIGCISYTISSSFGIFNYFYIDCECNSVMGTIDATDGYTEQTFCASQDSVSPGPLTLTNNGYCGFPIDLCYDSSSSSLACDCGPSPTPTPSPTPNPTGFVEQTYILFGAGDSNSACANLIVGPTFHLRTLRYSVNSFLAPGDTLYDGPGLTNPTVFPIPVYYAYYVNNNNNIPAWVYVGTDGVVIQSGYCT